MNSVQETWTPHLRLLAIVGKSAKEFLIKLNNAFECSCIFVCMLTCWHVTYLSFLLMACMLMGRPTAINTRTYFLLYFAFPILKLSYPFVRRKSPSPSPRWDRSQSPIPRRRRSSPSPRRHRRRRSRSNSSSLVNNSCSPSRGSEQNSLIEKQRKEEEEKKR